LHVSVESVLVQDSEPVAAELADGAVVLSVRAGAYFSFNCTATEIWDILAEPCCLRQIFALLAERYDVDAETVARDVTPFLQTLIKHRLVRTVNPVSPS
jgi:Coenzyme PQQ synthesis protein D (PqqD)